MSGTVKDDSEDVGAIPARGVPYLVLALECDRPLAGAARFSLEGLQAATIGRGELRAATRSRTAGPSLCHVSSPSPALSTLHVRLVRTAGDWVVEDLGSTNGTYVNGARVQRANLRPWDVLTVGRTLFTLTDARLTGAEVAADEDAAGWTSDRAHRTLDPELHSRLSALEHVARSNISVVVQGETGAGKEVLARSVHDSSGRSGAFVGVNCGALPGGLVEGLLFGHVKGAFSGAVRDEPGFFRSADGGTLFLDEIGELTPQAQVALLRVLQEREVTPVGGTKPVRIDVRVVAATHRPLAEMVNAGSFRRDLLARLSGFTIELPALRARRMDLGVLVASLLRRIAGDDADRVRFTPSAGLAILRYDWPHNTRELEQCLARALVLARDGHVQAEHLPAAVTDAKVEPPQRDDALVRLSERDERVRLELLGQLALHKGNVAEVARAMGKVRMQIHRWCHRFGIDPNVYRK